jgi:hypothetical protein
LQNKKLRKHTAHLAWLANIPQSLSRRKKKEKGKKNKY